MSDVKRSAIGTARATSPSASEPKKAARPLFDREEVKRLYETEDEATVELLGLLLAGARGTRLDPIQLKAIEFLFETRSARLGASGQAVGRIEVVFGDDASDQDEDR